MSMPSRFFTPLRCVQNDMWGALRCVQNDMWGALRCVQNDMWGALRCVQNDMWGRCAAFRMTCVGALRKKVALIEGFNPRWEDLSRDWFDFR